MVGTFSLHVGSAETTLSLAANHTFREQYAPARGETVSCSGPWSWDAATHKLSFDNGFLPPGVYPMHETKADCTQGVTLAVLRDFNGIYLEVNPDDGTTDFRKLPEYVKAR